MLLFHYKNGTKYCSVSSTPLSVYMKMFVFCFGFLCMLWVDHWDSDSGTGFKEGKRGKVIFGVWGEPCEFTESKQEARRSNVGKRENDVDYSPKALRFV